MIQLKVGCNFDMNLIHVIEEANTLNDKVKVIELYGSDRSHSFLAARPDYRLPDISLEYFSDYVKSLKKIGVNFNYTLNSINPGSLKELSDKKEEIHSFIKKLEDMGVYRVTCSHPLLIEMVKNSSSMKIELSTIAHIDTITQIKLYKEMGVDKFCMNLMKNRDIKFLTKFNEVCKRLDCIVELMANEFCGTASNDGLSLTHCHYRDSCYICHSTNKTKEDSQLFNTYPMNRCILGRNTSLYNWLRTRFILPQDMKRYSDIGIQHFKITGRTGSTDYIKKVIFAYVNELWDGNLLGLWKQLDTIYNENLDDAKWEGKYFIDSKKLDSFLDKWFKNDFVCSEQFCGEDCTYCQEYYERKIKDGI